LHQINCLFTQFFCFSHRNVIAKLSLSAAVSLPLRSEGLSIKKAFAIDALSGIVEPLSGLIGAALVLIIINIIPFMLSFAAGAMIYVIVEELVPEAHSKHTNVGTLGAMTGFVLMMVLDVAFG
jgi:ZIP family zinc transporter